MRVKITAYRKILIIETIALDDNPDWFPFGNEKIGCLILNTKKNLGVSEEALELLRKVSVGYDAIGDVDWFQVDNDHWAFGWIGDVNRIIYAEKVEGSRNYEVPDGDYTIIPNDVPEGALETIGKEVKNGR